MDEIEFTSTTNDYRIYLLGTSAVAVLLACCLATINFVIDPYDIYPATGTYSPTGRPELISHMRLHKAYALRHQRAEHIVIGSSRSASLPPGVLGKAAYNASLPGVWMRELRLMLEHAHTVRPLKSVFISLDYYMFREENAGKMRADFAPDRLLKPAPPALNRLAQYHQRATDYWNSLFAVDALLESARMISGGNNQRVDYMDDGTWIGTPEKPPRWLYSYVNQKRTREFLAESGALDFREFEALLDFLAANNVDTTLFISPYHGSVMNSVRLAGAWENYLAWQQMVSNSVSAYGTGMRVAGIEHNAAIILEAIDSNNPFFTDGMHYSLEAGRSIMECVTKERCTDRVAVHLLGPDNTEEYLRDVDRLMKTYPDKNPGDFAALQGWLENILKSDG
jgi:hypothetical protein